jgi:hypothetical protein
VRDREEWGALLDAYGFDEAPDEPESVENEQYRLVCKPEHAFPCIVRVQRKPQGPVQEAAWNFAAETSMARIELQDDELGVRFLDENSFVPFAQLDYEPGRGFRMGMKGETPTPQATTGAPADEGKADLAVQPDAPGEPPSSERQEADQPASRTRRLHATGRARGRTRGRARGRATSQTDEEGTAEDDCA